MANLNRFLIPIFATVLFCASCKKENTLNNNPAKPDLTTKIQSSLSGFVTNENNAAVEGATVVVGTKTTTTNAYGYFELRNVDVVKNAATITVTQNGYFKSIKTYIAEQGKPAFFRIKLLPKTIAGTVDAAAGGNVTLPSGMKISLPANAVAVNTATGAAYTGQVSVAAHWIDPTAADLYKTMPGDLRGLDTEGDLKLLQTFGMVAVELTGAGGEQLQIASGKTATVTFPLPATISGTAPASIPLWYFDETNGLWKQEGTAAKTGNTYVGNVSHFSFWNCDVPGDFVQFDCIVQDGNGNPIPYALVKISVVGSSNNSSNGYTDSSGYVHGAIPGNAQLLLEIFNEGNCTAAVYSRNFSSTNVAVSLGAITVDNSVATADVTGTVTDCNGAQLGNGQIIAEENGVYSVYTADNTGAFNFTRILCNGTASINLTARNPASLEESAPNHFSLTEGANTTGNIQACGSLAEFMTVSADGGNPITILDPPNDIRQAQYQLPPFEITVVGRTTNSQLLFFTFEPAGASAGSSQPLGDINTCATFFCNGYLIPGQVVHLTEFGPVGGFIAGNFNVTMRENSANGPIPHTVSCSFRVRRDY